MKVLLLGVGMQGKAALHDLVATSPFDEIIAADADMEMLRSYVNLNGWGRRVRCKEFDAADLASLNRLMDVQPDVVVDLLPAAFIPNVARAAVGCGANLVNTFYVSPELRRLEREAIGRGVTILPEFGLDPGIDLVMLGEASRSLDAVEEVRSYGAGIPEIAAADNPLRYKVSWTFEGVLEAYGRPARTIREGTVIEIDRTDVFSAQNVHNVEIGGVGLLEAHPNGDVVDYVNALGLDVRSLRAAGRYTMRWPGHCAFWKNMVDLHLLDPEPVELDGILVDRVRFLASAIGPHIQYAPGERDVVVVRVEVIGRKGRRRRRLRYELVDRLDTTTGLSGMSRTVGFMASIGSIMIEDGRVTGPGLLCPATDVAYDLLVDELGKRGINIVFEESSI